MESVDEGKARDRERQKRPDNAATAASVKGKGKGKAKGKELEDEEFLGIKLRRGVLVGKRCGGAYTPPPTWSFPDQINNFPSPATTTSSARQLGANLWEILPHMKSMDKIEKGSGGDNGSRHYQYGSGGGLKKKGLLIQPVLEEDEEEADSDDGPAEQRQPGSAGSSFHRQIAESLRRHHRSVAQNSRALQPVSPASFTSSMEVTPYNPAGTPTSSIELKGGGTRNHDPSYSLQTSTELLKVLNRIWSLEEQHASNLSLVKALKTELSSSRGIIKELLKEKQVDRQVIDNLMKQVSDFKLAMKNTNTLEQDRMRSTLQSVKEELEDERRLRKRSESLHRKLARELSEVKSSVNKVVSELERERRGRVLLEELCDEFAMSVREYEQEMRLLSSSKQRNEKNHFVRSVGGDSSLILLVSEAWLDERMQIKMDAGGSEQQELIARKSMVVEKLGSEIEAFLQARQQQQMNNSNKKLEDDYLPAKDYLKEQHCIRRQSLESFPLNEAGSAPKNLDDYDYDEDSVDSESNCFELSKMVSEHRRIDGLQGQDGGGDSSQRGKTIDNGIVNNSELVRSVVPGEVNSGGTASSGMSCMRARFEQHMARTILSNQGKTQAKFSTAPVNPPVEMGTTLCTTQKSEEISGGSKDRKSQRFGLGLMGSILSNNSSSIEGEKIHPEDTLVGEEPHGHRHFMLAGTASPVKKWEPRLRGGEPEITESSSSTRWVSKGVKENTLKAKLMEARLEGRNHHQSKGL